MPETGVERTDTGRVFRYYSTLLYTTRLNLIKRYYRIYIYIFSYYTIIYATRLNLIKRYYRIYIFRYYSTILYTILDST